MRDASGIIPDLHEHKWEASQVYLIPDHASFCRKLEGNGALIEISGNCLTTIQYICAFCSNALSLVFFLKKFFSWEILSFSLALVFTPTQAWKQISILNKSSYFSHRLGNKVFCSAQCKHGATLTSLPLKKKWNNLLPKIGNIFF